MLSLEKSNMAALKELNTKVSKQARIKPDDYTLLPTVPFRAIDKTNSAYRNIVVTRVKNGIALVHSTFADGYRKFERKLSVDDIELILKHNCNPDSFNKHCQTCGKYCG